MSALQEQLNKIFYEVIEKKEGPRELSPEEIKDISEVTEMIANTMDEMGLTIEKVTYELVETVPVTAQDLSDLGVL